MTPERKPIVVMYIPKSDFFSPKMPPSELMAMFNNDHDRIKMPEAFYDYLWFVFVNGELVAPELKVFHDKDYTETQYEDLKTMIQEGINSLKK